MYILQHRCEIVDYPGHFTSQHLGILEAVDKCVRVDDIFHPKHGRYILRRNKVYPDFVQNFNQMFRSGNKDASTASWFIFVLWVLACTFWCADRALCDVWLRLGMDDKHLLIVRFGFRCTVFTRGISLTQQRRCIHSFHRILLVGCGTSTASAWFPRRRSLLSSSARRFRLSLYNSDLALQERLNIFLPL